MSYANAVHQDPLIVRNHEVLKATIPRGFPVGCTDKRKYPTCEFVLESGDTMIIYTDGIPEAFRPNGKMIGFPAFEEILPSLTRKDCQETEQAIRSWFAKVVRPGPQDDDITLLVVRIS